MLKIEMSLMHPLMQVSKHISDHAGEVLVVFDLDSTLFNVSPRTEQILKHFASREEYRDRFISETEVLRDVEVLPTDWGVREVLQRHISTSTHEFISEIRNFWRKNFFSNHFLDHDQPYPSAAEYVGHLSGLGAKIKYLTGRSEVKMCEGTLKSLRRHQFPLADEAHLIMKPNEIETDEGFKTKVLRELSSKYRHIWLFENEPVIIADIRQALPMVNIVFVDSTHARRFLPPDDILRIGMSYSQGLP